MTITDLDAAAKGRLAERMVPVAMALVGVVRDQDADGVTRFLAGLSEAEREALPVILAAMVLDTGKIAKDKLCAACDSPFRPQRKTQQTCSRSCGAILRSRRNAKPWTERFYAKILVTKHGLEWAGARNPTGYGKLDMDGHTVAAHRLAYELWVGPIPAGLQLDHLCRVRHCVTPDHLEAVTARVNVRRNGAQVRIRQRNPGAQAERAKTHCPQRHRYDEANTYTDKSGSRHCRACGRERAAGRRAVLAARGK